MVTFIVSDCKFYCFVVDMVIFAVTSFLNGPMCMNSDRDGPLSIDIIVFNCLRNHQTA